MVSNVLLNNSQDSLFRWFTLFFQLQNDFGHWENDLAYENNDDLVLNRLNQSIENQYNRISRWSALWLQFTLFFTQIALFNQQKLLHNRKPSSRRDDSKPSKMHDYGGFYGGRRKPDEEEDKPRKRFFNRLLDRYVENRPHSSQTPEQRPRRMYRGQALE